MVIGFWQEHIFGTWWVRTLTVLFSYRSLIYDQLSQTQTDHSFYQHAYTSFKQLSYVISRTIQNDFHRYDSFIPEPCFPLQLNIVWYCIHIFLFLKFFNIKVLIVEISIVFQIVLQPLPSTFFYTILPWIKSANENLRTNFLPRRKQWPIWVWVYQSQMDSPFGLVHTILSKDFKGINIKNASCPSCNVHFCCLSFLHSFEQLARFFGEYRTIRNTVIH